MSAVYHVAAPSTCCPVQQVLTRWLHAQQQHRSRSLPISALIGWLRCQINDYGTFGDKLCPGSVASWLFVLSVLYGHFHASMIKRAAFHGLVIRKSACFYDLLQGSSRYMCLLESQNGVASDLLFLSHNFRKYVKTFNIDFSPQCTQPSYSPMQDIQE